MKFKILIAGTMAAGGLIAAQQSDLAALYVAISAPILLGVLHAIEVKLNRLLDYHGIYVSKREIDKA